MHGKQDHPRVMEAPMILIFYKALELLRNNGAKPMQKCLQTILRKKSRIRRETKHISTDADSSTDGIGGWTKNTQNPSLFLTEKITKNAKTQKRLEV